MSSQYSTSPSVYEPTQPTPTAIPDRFYRVHHEKAQTLYDFGTGFSAKNQTTILNYTTSLCRFGLAHIHQQTNISSPFISVYDNLAHAEHVARNWAQHKQHATFVVTIDTRHLARGPIFRAADLLRGESERNEVNLSSREAAGNEWLHWGEYLVLYRIPPQAVQNQTPIAQGVDQNWRTVGVIGRK